MIFNVTNQTSEQIDGLILLYGNDYANSMGMAFSLCFLDENETTLEIKLYGDFNADRIKPIISPIGLRSAKYCNSMNKFPA